MADRDADLGHPVHHTEVPYAELTTWLARHALTLLQAHGAPDELLQRIRLLGGSALARLQVLRSSGRGLVLLV
jgi:hypothetical protein